MVYAQVLIFILLAIRFGVALAKDGQPRHSCYNWVEEGIFALAILTLVWTAGGFSIFATHPGLY